MRSDASLGLNSRPVDNALLLLLDQPPVGFGLIQCSLVLLDFQPRRGLFRIEAIQRFRLTPEPRDFSFRLCEIVLELSQLIRRTAAGRNPAFVFSSEEFSARASEVAFEIFRVESEQNLPSPDGIALLYRDALQ